MAQTIPSGPAEVAHSPRTVHEQVSDSALASPQVTADSSNGDDKDSCRGGYSVASAPVANPAEAVAEVDASADFSNRADSGDVEGGYADAAAPVPSSATAAPIIADVDAIAGASGSGEAGAAMAGVVASNRADSGDSDLDGWTIADPVAPLVAPESVASIADPSEATELDLDVTATTPPQPLRVEVAAERPLALMDASKIHAVLSIIAPPEVATARAALRLVAVLDKSGSMTGNKLNLVVQTMRFMLQHLSERDALGIVEYGERVKVLARLTRCDAEGRQRLDAALGKLVAGGQTNLSGGLLRGIELHREAIHGGATNQMQRFLFGNTYRRLSEEEAEESAKELHGCAAPPSGYKRQHAWAMEFRFENPEDAACVQKVVYTLHHTFAQPVVEVTEGPFFRLSRFGWGSFPLVADLHLADGRVLTLDHGLSFRGPETFNSATLPLRTCLAQPSGLADDDERSAVRSTFLFTDGLANVGIRKPEDICDAATAALAESGDHRCTISTFGFGDDHSAELLQGIAEAGNGIYSYVENEDKIGTAFGEALGGLLSTTHQNVRLSLDLQPGVRFLQAKTSFQVEPSTPGKSDGKETITISIDDLYAEERRDILVELALLPTELEGPQTLGFLSARGFSILAKRTEEVAPAKFDVHRRAEAQVVRDAPCHPQVERHQNRHLTTEALEAARRAARTGDLPMARSALNAAITAIGGSSLAGNGDSASLGFLADLNECLADLRNQEDYFSKGSKKMACMKGSHEKQRKCAGMGFSEAYTNNRTRTVGEACSSYSNK